MEAKCIVCEQPVIEHPFIKNVFYCKNSRCTRLGVLTVFVLEIKKDDQSVPQPGGK
jgi:hypothetical protein